MCVKMKCTIRYTVVFPYVCSGWKEECEEKTEAKEVVGQESIGQLRGGIWRREQGSAFFK